MNKNKIVAKLLEKIESDLATLTQAALSAHHAATHAESRAEDQYDTRGLEASYLAGAQSKRAMELQELVDLFRHLDMNKFDPTTPISATALVELRDEEGREQTCLLMPKGGGFSVLEGNKVVQVVTPQSPLGSALLGRLQGEEIDVEVRGARRSLEILRVS